MIYPRLGDLLGPTLTSGSRCFYLSGCIRLRAGASPHQVRPYQIEDETIERSSRRADQDTGDKDEDTAEDDLENC
jgi:hypothetical protein